MLASTASKKPVKTEKSERTFELVKCAANKHGAGRPVMFTSSSSSSEWNNDDKWSSQVRKSGKMSETSTERPVSNKLVIDIDMDYDTAAESDLSPKYRSFLNKVNGRLRKMLNRSAEDSMQDVDKRSMIWRMFMFFDSGRHLYSWERTTQTIYIPSNIQGKISL